MDEQLLDLVSRWFDAYVQFENMSASDQRKMFSRTRLSRTEGDLYTYVFKYRQALSPDIDARAPRHTE